MQPGFFSTLAIARREHLLSLWLRRHARLLSVLMLAVLLLQVFWWYIPTRDSVSYLSIARSLWVHFPPTNLSSTHLYYQPGYPLLISPLFLLAQDPFLLISALHILLAGGVLLCVYRWWRPVFPRPAVLLVTALVAFSGAFLHYTRTALSEVPSMFWLLTSALTLRRVLAERRPAHLLGWVVLASLLVTCASITRYVYILIVAGFALAGFIAAWRQQITLRRAILLPFAIGLPALAAVLAAICYDHSTVVAGSGSTATYFDHIRFSNQTLLQQAIESLRLRISEIGRLLVPGMLHAHSKTGEWLSANTLIYTAVAIVFAIGWWRLFRRTTDILSCMTPFYIAAYLVWPWDAGVRFFTPLLPVLWASIWALLQSQRVWRYTLLATLAGLHLAVALGMHIAEGVKDQRLLRTYWEPCVQFARDALPGAKLFVRGPANPDVEMWLCYLTDRPTLRLAEKAPIPDSAGDIVQPASLPLPAGYEVVRSAHPLVLLRRTAPADGKQ